MGYEQSLISDELRSQIGTELSRRVSFPVDASDIRRWAIAVYWPEPAPPRYWDAEYASKTAAGEIVAPHEFNPFAWPADPKSNHYNNVVLTSASGRPRLLGGTDTTYYAPIRVGDVITEVETLASVTEKRRESGSTLFIVKEYRWTNQRSELVKVELYTIIER